MAELDKVRRILEELKATREFLRQYPGLARSCAAWSGPSGDRPGA
jgi:hypothetical protein